MSPKSEELLRPRDAAAVLGVSYASLKQWIYKGKLRTVKTAGGHHRIPQSEIDRYLFKSLGKQPAERRASFRTVKTAGGHHRIPQSEIDRYLFKSLGKQPAER